ncbi:hypothetical protein FB451DRAFT_1241975 [Mycena latifolia]|nr:hypothetical protein FB451DRAFT_1241975 [Mycena latifolia]
MAALLRLGLNVPRYAAPQLRFRPLYECRVGLSTRGLGSRKYKYIDSQMTRAERNTVFHEVEQNFRALYPGGIPPPPPCWDEPERAEYYEAIYEDWYTSLLVQEPWSDDWRRWRGVDEFAYHRIPLSYNVAFGIPGTIEPLAYLNWGEQDDWLFTAGGKYYFYTDEEDVVIRFEHEFESHDDFFRWKPLSREECWTKLRRREWGIPWPPGQEPWYSS